MISRLLSVAVALSMVLAGSGEVFAASNWTINLNSKVFVGQTKSVSVMNSKTGKDGTITSVQSSKDAVIKVVKNGSGSGAWYEIEPLKTGKAKITVEFKTDSGKQKTLSKTLTVKKYPKPIKSFTVNGKKIDTGKNKYKYTKSGYTKTKATIQMKVKEGWSINSASGNLYSSKSKKSKEIKSVKSKVKKGKEISFPKDYDNLNVYVSMSKDDLFIDYSININRNASKAQTSEWTIGSSISPVFVGLPRTINVRNTKTGETAKVTSVTSSDKSIVKPKKKKSGDTTFYQIKPLKKGTAKITVKFKTSSGKKQSLTKKITVKKYPNQIKSLTVNGKSVDVSKNKYTYNKKFTGKKAKIGIKVKKGWTVYYASGSLYSSEAKKSKAVDDVLNKVKEEKNISFPAKYDSLNVYILMISDKGASISYTITLHR